MAIAAIGVPMAVVFGVVSYRSVVKPLEIATVDIERMSAGDLTGRIVASGIEELAHLMQSLRVAACAAKPRKYSSQDGRFLSLLMERDHTVIPTLTEGG